MWYIPFTEGYHIQSGYEAFRQEDIYVTTNQITQLTNIKSEQRNSSIRGELQCIKDPVIACFDTLARCVSMTGITVGTFLKEQTGNRQKCFSFYNIYSPPYNIRYSLNCLPIGKYAIVIAEPPTEPEEYFKISWYGGPTYSQTIVGADDVASLDVPENVTWVEITSENQIVDLSDFTTNQKNNGGVRTTPDNAILHLKSSNLVIHLPSTAHKATLNIFNLAGKLLKNLTLQNEDKPVVVNVSGLTSHQVIICKIKANGVSYNRKFLIN